MPRIRKEILKPGTYCTRVPRDGELRPYFFQFTKDDTDHFYRQGKAMLSSGLSVPIPLEHQDGAVPLDRAARLAHSVSHNTGFVADWHLGSDGTLSADLDIDWLPDTPADQIQSRLEKTIKYVSPEIPLEWIDGSGKRWDRSITHVALTPLPIAYKQTPFGEVAGTDGAAHPGIAMSLSKIDVPIRFSMADQVQWDTVRMAWQRVGSSKSGTPIWQQGEERRYQQGEPGKGKSEPQQKPSGAMEATVQRAEMEAAGTAPPPAKGSTVWIQNAKTGTQHRYIVRGVASASGEFLARNDLGVTRHIKPGEWRTNPADLPDDVAVPISEYARKRGLTPHIRDALEAAKGRGETQQKSTDTGDAANGGFVHENKVTFPAPSGRYDQKTVTVEGRPVWQWARLSYGARYYSFDGGSEWSQSRAEAYKAAKEKNLLLDGSRPVVRVLDDSKRAEAEAAELQKKLGNKRLSHKGNTMADDKDDKDDDLFDDDKPAKSEDTPPPVTEPPSPTGMEVKLREVAGKLAGKGIVVDPGRTIEEFIDHLCTALDTHEATSSLNKSEEDELKQPDDELTKPSATPAAEEPQMVAMSQMKHRLDRLEAENNKLVSERATDLMAAANADIAWLRSVDYLDEEEAKSMRNTLGTKRLSLVRQDDAKVGEVLAQIAMLKKQATRKLKTDPLLRDHTAQLRMSARAEEPPEWAVDDEKAAKDAGEELAAMAGVPSRNGK